MILDEIKAHVRQFNWLTAMALACVAVTSAFIMVMAWKLTETIAAPDWCARAIKAEQLSGERASSSCVDLLMVQVKSLAVDNHIYAVTLAVCLGVLVVVVLAKAKLDIEVTKEGLKSKVGRDDAEAAQQVADSAQDKADEIKEVAP